MMISLLLSCLIQTRSQVSGDLAPIKSICSSYGFEDSDPHPENGFTSRHYQFSSGSQSLQVSIHLWTDKVPDELRLPRFKSSANGIAFPRTNSGWPLGERAFAEGGSVVDRGTIHLGAGSDAVAERVSVSLDLSESRAADSGADTKSAVGGLQDRLEAILRRTLSEVLAEDLDDQGRARGLRTVRGLDRGHDGYAPLEVWSAQNKVTVAYDSDKWRATFTIKGHVVYLALGSDQARVDDNWIELGQFVICKKGKWMIPGQVLDMKLSRFQAFVSRGCGGGSWMMAFHPGV